MARAYPLGFDAYDLAIRVVRAHDASSDEAIAGVMMLLLCWNAQYYYRQGRMDYQLVDHHIGLLREALSRHRHLLRSLKLRRLEEVDFDQTLCPLSITVGEALCGLYRDLSRFLGATGASKALHLLLPDLIVMWDSGIRGQYHLPATHAGFLRFHELMQSELKQALRTYVAGHGGTEREAIRAILRERYGEPVERPITKVLDEYNWVLAHLDRLRAL